MNRSILYLILILVMFTCCDGQSPQKENYLPPPKRKVADLKKIIEKGEITALTDFNSTDYFLYRGMPMGFQYELLQNYAKHLGVELKIIVNNNLGESFAQMENGECDLIAKNLTITKSRNEKLNFTSPHSQTRQILVQRKPDDWIMKNKREIDSELIRNQLDLAQKKIFVQKNSSFANRLKNLMEEIGDTIHIVETVRYSDEELIMLVSTGKIDFTVCDENVAKVNSRYYANIDIETAISFPQNVAWAVRKNASELKKDINKWMRKFKKSKEFENIFKKYFENPRSALMVRSEQYSLRSGKISKYDDIIKKESTKIGWDWRLLASLIYTESRFKPTARSWAGAYGLMQIMPCTFQDFGGDTTISPAENIRVGVKLLKWLDNRFKDKVEDENERIKFILAAYNVGFGHIEDAIRLTEKFGGDPFIWDNNVEHYLRLKTNPKYYKDSAVIYGYCRGNIPTIYVKEILERYAHYQQLVKNKKIKPTEIEHSA